jgi:hypothetical protein
LYKAMYNYNNLKMIFLNNTIRYQYALLARWECSIQLFRIRNEIRYY